MAKVDTYRYENPSELGRTEAGDAIFLGGFSSLCYAGKASGNFRFFTNTDRGPNADEIDVNGRQARPFALPDFQPEILELELDPAARSVRIHARIPLVGREGDPLTGLPNTSADELALDLRGLPLPLDPNGCDAEGLARAEDGTFWLAEEYGPSLVHVGADGGVLARYGMPSVFTSRRRNRGFEGLTRSGAKLYAILQSPLLRGLPHEVVRGIRLLEWDLATNAASAIYLYLPDGDPAKTKIGDIASLGNGRFLVLEQNGETGAEKAIQKIFEIDLTNATDILCIDDSLHPFETRTEAELRAAGIHAVARKPWLDLKGLGLDHLEKLEGLAVIDENTIAIVNDNDFGLAGGFDPATGRLESCADPVVTEIRIITR